MEEVRLRSEEKLHQKLLKMVEIDWLLHQSLIKLINQF
jgi:hypothetical protein